MAQAGRRMAELCSDRRSKGKTVRGTALLSEGKVTLCVAVQSKGIELRGRASRSKGIVMHSYVTRGTANAWNATH